MLENQDNNSNGKIELKKLQKILKDITNGNQ